MWPLLQGGACGGPALLCVPSAHTPPPRQHRHHRDVSGRGRSDHGAPHARDRERAAHIAAASRLRRSLTRTRYCGARLRVWRAGCVRVCVLLSAVDTESSASAVAAESAADDLRLRVRVLSERADRLRARAGALQVCVIT